MKVNCKCKFCKKEWKVKRNINRQVKEIKRNSKIIICQDCDYMSNDIMLGYGVYYK